MEYTTPTWSGADLKLFADTKVIWIYVPIVNYIRALSNGFKNVLII